MTRPWDAYIAEADRDTIARGRFSRRTGFGTRPALLVIDCQRYMVGERGENDGKHPSSCGRAGWAAVDRIVELCNAARRAEVPVFLTKFTLDPSGNDIGVYGRKREFLQIPHWCLDGTPGAELLPELGPEPTDIVFVKKKPSAFFGTPLTSLPVDRGIDTVIVCCGATSNCVRATVFDASSLNYRTIVAEEAVMDRIRVLAVSSG